MHVDKRKRGMPLLVCLALVIVACSSDKPAEGDARVVASVGDRELTLGDLREYLDSRQLVVTSENDRDKIAEFLDEMILAESMYQEAMRLELDQVPDVRRAMQQTLNQRLLQKTITEPVLSRKIPDAELQVYFEQHRWEYAWPEQMRVADIFIAVPEGENESEKAMQRERAEALLAEAKQQQGERFGFSRLVREHSDKHPAYRLGDTGYFDREGQPVGIDPAVAGAAFTLEKNGELYPGVIEGSKGYHVILRVGHRAAQERTYEDVRASLEQRIRSDELRSKQREYLESLRARTATHIEMEELDSLVQELQRAASEKPSKVKTGTPPVGGVVSMPPPLPGETR